MISKHNTKIKSDSSLQSLIHIKYFQFVDPRETGAFRVDKRRQNTYEQRE